MTWEGGRPWVRIIPVSSSTANWEQKILSHRSKSFTRMHHNLDKKVLEVLWYCLTKRVEKTGYLTSQDSTVDWATAAEQEHWADDPPYLKGEQHIPAQLISFKYKRLATPRQECKYWISERKWSFTIFTEQGKSSNNNWSLKEVSHLI